MALRDFWINVRTGARIVAPNVIADLPRIDSAEVERLLRSSTVWLKPNTVHGFNAADFEFLPVDERQALAQAVDRFRAIAGQAPLDGAASDQHIEDGLREFQHILEIVRPNRYADPEAWVLGKRVEGALAGGVPPSVAELRFETGDDAHGGPALWIWVILKDEAAEEDVLLSNAQALRELLRQTVQDLGIDRWPYIRFRSESELEQLASEVR